MGVYTAAPSAWRPIASGFLGTPLHPFALHTLLRDMVGGQFGTRIGLRRLLAFAYYNPAAPSPHVRAPLARHPAPITRARVPSLSVRATSFARTFRRGSGHRGCPRRHGPTCRPTSSSSYAATVSQSQRPTPPVPRANARQPEI